MLGNGISNSFPYGYYGPGTKIYMNDNEQSYNIFKFALSDNIYKEVRNSSLENNILYSCSDMIKINKLMTKDKFIYFRNGATEIRKIETKLKTFLLSDTKYKKLSEKDKKRMLGIFYRGSSLSENNRQFIKDVRGLNNNQVEEVSKLFEERNGLNYKLLAYLHDIPYTKKNMSRINGLNGSPLTNLRTILDDMYYVEEGKCFATKRAEDIGIFVHPESLSWVPIGRISTRIKHYQDFIDTTYKLEDFKK